MLDLDEEGHRHAGLSGYWIRYAQRQNPSLSSASDLVEFTKVATVGLGKFWEVTLGILLGWDNRMMRFS